jgi:hypothetical protein
MCRSTVEELDSLLCLPATVMRLDHVDVIGTGRAIFDLALVDVVTHPCQLILNVGSPAACTFRSKSSFVERLDLLLSDLDALACLRDELLLRRSQITLGILCIGDRALDE